MLKHLFILLLVPPAGLLAQFSSSSAAVETPAAPHPALLYVPFNDCGKWGYSDTLANLTIKPRYSSAGRFNEFTNGARPLIVAQAKRRGRTLLLDTAGKNLLPRKTSLVVLRQTRGTSGQHFLCLIADKQGRITRFHPERPVGSQRTYEPVAEYPISDYRNPLVLRDQSTGTISYYDQNMDSLVNTSIKRVVRLNTVEQPWRTRLYAITPTNDTLGFGAAGFGSQYFVSGPSYRMDTPAERVERDQDLNEPPMFVDVSESGGYELPERDRIRLRKAFRVDSLHVQNSFSNYMYQAYGISKLYVASRNGKLGVVDQDGNERLPFVYDKITMENNGSQAAIHRDGKVGRKLFFTTYPTIEPAYDWLIPYHQYRVTPRWVFAVFQAGIGKEYVLIGENGMRYYRK